MSDNKKDDKPSLGPVAKEGEHNFGVAHIFASFNDTFVHVTDISGRETISRVTGGMKVKADRDEASPYAAMLAAQDVAVRCKELGVTALHIKIRATGGNKQCGNQPVRQAGLEVLFTILAASTQRDYSPERLISAQVQPKFLRQERDVVRQGRLLREGREL